MNNTERKPMLWTRREAILRASAALGGTALVGQTLMLAGCEREPAVIDESPTNAGIGEFSSADIELLAEIAETILPETSTPGARAAGVGPFIALMVTDAYSPDEQQTFREGLATIDDVSRQVHGSDFINLATEHRLDIAQRLDREQYDASQSGVAGPRHYFRMFKELTVLGFFTSELAYNEVLEYEETPGRYDGNRDLEPGGKIFAGHGSNIYTT